MRVVLVERVRMPNADEDAIALLVEKMYGVFSNTDGRRPNLALLNELFIPQGLIIKAVGDPPEITGVQQFIEPRAKILSDGTLSDFEEWETSGETRVFGNIAHRLSYYSKKGALSGVRFEADGVKTMQFVRARGEWKLSSISWFDYSSSSSSSSVASSSSSSTKSSSSSP